MDKHPPTRKAVKPTTQPKSEPKKQNRIIRFIIAISVIVAGVAAFITNSSTIVNFVESTYHSIFPSLPTPMPTITLPPLGTTFCTYRGHKGDVNSVAWSPNGRYIASAGKDGTVRVWNASTCQDITIYRGHQGSVNSIAWSPDSSRIVSGGDDATVQVSLADTGSLLFNYSPSGCAPAGPCGDCSISSFKQVSSVAWSPDSGYIAFGSVDGHIRVFDADTGVCSFSLDTQWVITSIGWSVDSKRIAFGGNTPKIGENGVIQIWNINTHSLVLSDTLDKGTGIGGILTAMEISPDSKSIMLTFEGGDLCVFQVWNINNKKFTVSDPMNYFGHFDCWFGVAWACDSRHAVVANEYDKVEEYDTTTGRKIYSYSSPYVTALAWSPDGTRVASAGDDGIVRVWQASDKRLC